MRSRLSISALVLVTCFTYLAANAQSAITVSGSVKNSASKDGVSAVSVLIKGTTSGAYTDEDGNFRFTTTQKPPFTLVISSIGYSSQEVQYNAAGQVVNVEITPTYALGEDVVVAASRVPERILESPVSIERVGTATIRNAPGANYYDVLANLKGVDITTSSYTFKTVSTRGFNGSGNLRFNQLVDGMDNTAPALNFSVGNVIGLTELDVDNMELLSGASSALYGSGGMNGTLLISSKDPFKYQGLSVQVKQGIMHISDTRRGASPFYDWSFRWGKKVSDHFAFKIGGQFIKTEDWQADDTTNLLRNNVDSKIIPGTRASDPNYDGVNVFGDEASASMAAFANVYQAQARAQIMQGAGIDIVQLLNASLPNNPTPAQIAGFISALPAPLQQPVSNLLPFHLGLRNNIYANQSVSRTGYNEKDVVSYQAMNAKFSGGLYFKLNERVEASLTGNWGLGTSVYTGSDRYSLKNFTIGQYKLEFKSKSWFLRAYTTQENSGDSYASTLTALAINNSWKANSTWFGQYVGTYSGALLGGAGNVTPAQAHAFARGAADAGRFLPGSQEFKDAFNKSIRTPISQGGSQFADNSDLYQFEGQLNLAQYVKFVEILMGASYRWYNLDSKGTIFADTAGPIKISEYGGYIQLKKSLFNDVLKLSASGRYDKNENFDGRFTPRATATVKVAKDNHLRFSYQQAYRFPNNQDQWINLQTPGTILIGCLPGFNDYYKFSSNPVYTSESVVAYRASFNGTTADPTLLKVAEFKKAKPESMQSFEVGYRGVIGSKLLVDAYYYFSRYKDFIGRIAAARGNGALGNGFAELLSPFTSQNYSFVTNSPTPVKAYGWGVSAEYQLYKGYRAMANIYGDKLQDVPAGIVTQFNAPKIRYNLGFGNPNVGNGIGFNVIYKWQDKINWEGTFGTGEIPSFGTLDAQVSYKLPHEKVLLKLGGTNILNRYYRNAFGNPYVGGLYYVSVGYNVF
ncbi:TonB-dependent receptor [Foetidibacter luteolus]|uniref:TonB-dependent receptor n=1 Tax=Foetidibacter luteolus TaxID=2608880 RepID=UPI00129B889C|nr:TonB-dependent receptor [Foetidibacter luteolus]